MISITSVACSAVGIVLVNAVVASAASAATVTFTFPNLNGNPTLQTQSSFDFASGGINLDVTNPVGGPFPTAGGTNTTAQGLCVWAQNGGTQTRCGFTTANADATTNLSGLSFTFDKSVKLTGFNVSSLTNLSSGSLTFGASPAVNFSTTGFNALPNIFVGANTPITFASIGNLSGTNDSGLIRISSLQVEEVPVPGPLPLFGAATAFTFSRRLRKRIKTNPIL